MKILLSIFLVFAGLVSLKAQLSDGGFPIDVPLLKSTTNDDLIQLPRFEMPKTVSSLSDANLLKSITFAHSFEVNYSPENSGVLYKYAGHYIWRLHIKSEDAKSLMLIFSKFHLPENARLFVYNPDKTAVLGAFTSKNNKPYNKLAVYPLPGEELILQYEEPFDVDFKGQLEIGKVNHDFIGVVSLKNSSARRLSGECNVDINCETESGLELQQRGVCRILADNEYGTATLVNNTARDGRPMILSAFHIYDNNETAQVTLYDFNYESPFCTGIDGYDNQSISGATALASSDRLDFMLVQLSANVPAAFRPYFVGWDATNAFPSNTYIIHHPNGDTKKISHDEGVCDSMSFSSNFLSNAHWKVLNWESGTTEAGSSGACLFNNDKRAVGTLSGGYASCTNLSYDAFARIDKMWDTYPEVEHQLKYWFDPLNSGKRVIDGFDPYEQSGGVCNVFSNFTIHDSLKIHNQFVDNEYVTESAECFSQFEYASISGLAIGLSDFSANSVNPELIVRIYSGENGPDTAVKQYRFPMNSLTKGAMNFLNFGEALMVEGVFYISVVINDSEGNSVELFQSGLRSYANSNSVFVKENGLWQAFSEYHIEEKGIALLMQPLICANSLVPDTGVIDYDNDVLKIYPNPAQSYVVVEFDADKAVDTPVNNCAFEVRIYDMTGKIAFQNTFANRKYAEINTQLLNPGIYVVQVLCQNEKFRSKLIVGS
ncbi:MAG: T9SS type A sorting domain-containing protein [Prolixibacteraceae bacterium]|nr:T9SS type A sorting domain-containing protein [Prolixibacteraceae bacterium]MBN2648339.1 T9SS type A sorting domain-containing protein [Prolixibacteraceae bacterium]